jgi:hypothetical protein
MSDCGELLDLGDWWFACSLEAGHAGDHRRSEAAYPEMRRPAYVVTWEQDPATVTGEVVPPTHDHDCSMHACWRADHDPACSSRPCSPSPALDQGDHP